MENTYRGYERRREGTHSRRSATHRGGRVALGPMEQRRLAQLLVCVALFLVVLVGKGVFPQQMSVIRAALTQTISGDTDFRAAFASLGKSISAGEPVMDTLGELWVDVFGGQKVTVVPSQGYTPMAKEENAFLNQEVTAEKILERDFDPLFSRAPTTAPVVAPTLAPQPSVVPTPAPTAPLEQPEPTAPASDPAALPLPEKTTMEKYDLGLDKTVTPVLGWVSSSYGWREHPVDGEEKFHSGVDLAVNNGTEVLAFADGVVDFIGESPDMYGQYTQITHANGVVTFYCHCSSLLVQKGQKVKAGDVIAASGDTGNATGPHLHFEVKKDGVRLNPLYYIKTQ